MSFQDQQVLVTGATGFLGGTLALKLASLGAKVRALVRTPEKAGFLPPEVERFHGDVTDADAMRRACAGCSVVFHAAASFTDMPSQIAINVEGTRTVMLAAGEARVERIVHVSSIAVYGSAYPYDVTEEMRLAPGAMPYAITKARAEAIVHEVGGRCGLSYIIIRPGMIYGRRGALWTDALFKLARLIPTPFVGDGSGSAFPIHVDDVVDFMLVAAQHPNAHNEAFHCTPDPSVTWREFVGSYSRLAGHDNWLPIPPPLVFGAAGIAQLLSPRDGVGREAPDAVQFLRRFITFKMTKARDLLGWQPKIDLPTGIALTADYLREAGLLT